MIDYFQLPELENKRNGGYCYWRFRSAKMAERYLSIARGARYPLGYCNKTLEVGFDRNYRIEKFLPSSYRYVEESDSHLVNLQARSNNSTNGGAVEVNEDQGISDQSRRKTTHVFWF